jgi:hypothetical protein
MSYRQVIDVIINGTGKIDNLVNQFAAAERAAAGLSESIESINQRLTDSPAATNRAMQGYERASRRWVAIMKARKRSSRAEDSPLITNEQRQASREAGAAATREASRDLSAARQRLRNAKIRERLLVAEVRRNKERQAAVDTARERLENSMEETMGNLTGAGLQSRRARTTTMAQRRTTRATRLDQRGLPSDIALKPDSRLGQRSNQISDRVGSINNFLDRLEELRTRVERTGGKNTNRNLQRIENLRSNLTAELGSLAEGLAEIQRITRGRRSTFNTARVFADKADTLFQTGEIDEKKRKKIIKGNENAIALANEDNVDAARTVLQSTKNTLDAENRRIANAKAIKAYQDKQYKTLIAGENTSLESQKERTREMFKYQDLIANTDRKIRSGKTLNSKELQAWMGDRTQRALPPMAGSTMGVPLTPAQMRPTGGARLIGQAREFLGSRSGQSFLEAAGLATSVPLTGGKGKRVDPNAPNIMGKGVGYGVGGENIFKIFDKFAKGVAPAFANAAKTAAAELISRRGFSNTVSKTEASLSGLVSRGKVADNVAQPVSDALADLRKEALSTTTPLQDLKDKLTQLQNTITGFRNAPGTGAGARGKAKRVDSLTSLLADFSTADVSGKVFRGGRSPEAAISKIVSSFNSATSQSSGTSSAAKNVVATFASGIASGGTRIAKAGADAMSRFKDSVKKALGIASPSRFMLEIVKNLVSTYIDGLTAAYPRIQAATDKAFNLKAPKIRSFDPSGQGSEMDTMMREFRYKIANLTIDPKTYGSLLNALPSSRMTTDLVGAANTRSMMTGVGGYMDAQKKLGPGDLEKQITKAYADYAKTVKVPNPWLGPVGDYKEFISKVTAATKQLNSDQLALPTAKIAGALPPATSAADPRQDRIDAAYRRSNERAAAVIAEDTARRVAANTPKPPVPPPIPNYVQTGTAKPPPPPSIPNWMWQKNGVPGSGAYAYPANPAFTVNSAGGGSGKPPGFGGNGSFNFGGGPSGGGSGFGSRVSAATGNANALLGLKDLGKLSRATNTQLELLQKALSETRDGMRTTDKQFRELTKTIAKVEDQQARRDPNADFLTKRFGSRGSAAISEGLIGGAFPLLFGQGLGASTGGLIGGAAGGAAGGMLGFGLSLIGTSIGSVVDTTVQNLKDLAAGLRSPNDAITALEASGIKVSTTLKFQVEQLQSVGRAYDAQTLVLQEVEKRLGRDGVRNLVALDAEQKKLDEQWSSIAGTIQGELLPALLGFTQVINGVLEVARAAAKDPVIGRLIATGLKASANAIPGAPAFITAVELAGARGKSTVAKAGAAGDVRPAPNPQEALADETARIEQSRKIADQVKSAYREAFNLQRRAYDLQRDGADLNRDITDYSYKKEREIFDLRQQAAEARINNNRAATQNRIESSDLDARKAFASATGFEQQLLTNVREVMRTRKEGEADIEQSRKKLELTLAKLNRDVEDYKRTTAREIEDIERRKLAYIRSVEDYKMQVADYVLDRAREAADLMRQAMTLPDIGAGGASGGIAAAIDRTGAAYQFRGVSLAHNKQPGDYQSDPRENFFFDRRPELINAAKGRIASLTQKDLAALAFTVLTEAGPTDIGKLDVAGTMVLRSAVAGNAPISAIAKQPGQFEGVKSYSRSDLESEAKGRQLFNNYDKVLSLLRGGMGGGIGGATIATTGATGIGSGAHLDARWADGRPITAADADRFIRVAGKTPSSFGVTSGYGPRSAPVPGASTFHRGIDFGTPAGLPITLTGGAQLAGSMTEAQSGGGGVVGIINTPMGQMKLLHLEKVFGGSIQAAGASQISNIRQPQFNETNIGPTPAAAPLNKDRLAVLTSMTGNEKEAQKILEEQIRLKQKGVELGQIEAILQDNQLPQLQQQGSALQGQLDARKKILDLSDNAASVADIEAEATARLGQIEKDRLNAIAKIQKQYKGDAESIKLVNKQASVAVDIAKKEEEQRKKNLELSNQLQGVERARTEIVRLQEEIAVGKAEAAALELGKLQASNVELLKASLLWKQASENQRKILENLTGQREQQSKINELQANYNGKLEDAQAKIADIFAGLYGLTEYQKALREIAAKGITNENGEADKILQTAKAVDSLNQKARQLERVRDVAQGWTDSFIGFNAELLKTGNLTEALQNWADDVSSKAIDMLLEITMRPMQEQVFKAITDFLGFEKPADPMVKPLTAMDTNVQGIRADVQAIRERLQSVAQPTTAANGIVPGPSSTAYQDSGSNYSQILGNVESLNGLFGSSAIALEGFQNSIIDTSNMFSDTSGLGSKAFSNMADNIAKDDARIKNAFDTRITAEEENITRLQEVGQKLGVGVQMLGSLAMGFAGFQTMKKGGAYNVLTGLAGIFGAVSGFSGGIGKMFGLQGFAEGGRPPLDRPSWIGEKGVPELWWPDTAGTIIPIDQLEGPDDGSYDGPAFGSGRGSSQQSGRFAATRAAMKQERDSRAISSNQDSRSGGQGGVIEVRSESTVINNVEYVTKEQHEKGMREAVKASQSLTYRDMRNSVSTRRRLGMG